MDKASSEYVNRLRERGYYRLVICPQRFDEGALPFSELEGILRNCAIDRGGIYFPAYWPSVSRVFREQDWIGQEHDIMETPHLWKLWRSGAFLYARGLRDDWSNDSISPTHDGKTLSVEFVMYQLSCAVEFTARLLHSASVYEQGLHVLHQFVDLKNRSLVQPSGRGPFMYERTATLATWVYPASYQRSLDVREQSRSVAKDLFSRFDWEPTDATLNSLLDGL